MPNYKGHLVGGFFVYCIIIFCLLAQTPSLFLGAEWLLCTLLGALFPDIDTKSKGRKIFYRTLFGLAIIFLYKQRVRALFLLLIIAIIPSLVRHRGIFHTWWFVVGLPLGLICYSKICLPAYATLITADALFFIAGALSHLWLDLGIKRMFRW